MIEVLRPDGDVIDGGSGGIAARIGALDGRVVGVVNNTWRCMDIITSELATQLPAQYGVRDVVEERVSSAQRVADERLDALAEACDAVVVGICN